MLVFSDFVHTGQHCWRKHSQGAHHDKRRHASESQVLHGITCVLLILIDTVHVCLFVFVLMPRDLIDIDYIDLWLVLLVLLQGHSNVKLQLAATFCISNLVWNEEDGEGRRENGLIFWTFLMVWQQMFYCIFFFFLIKHSAKFERRKQDNW